MKRLMRILFGLALLMAGYVLPFTTAPQGSVWFVLIVTGALGGLALPDRAWEPR